jgi:hypothetical protein
MENVNMPLTDTSYAADLLLAERSVGLFTSLEISAEDFKAAYDLPIGQHVEKDYKGLSYLSWPFAFFYLKQHFPSFYVAFEEQTHGNPVFGNPGAYFLRPYLTDGVRRTAALVFPVMDRRHNSIKELDGRAISDNVQRASVKAIATFTGLGLKLYAGEDIPTADDAKEASAPAARATKETPTAKTAPVAAGATEATVSNGAEVFDGKGALLAFCRANPLEYSDEQESLMAGKEALESLGMNKADELKSAADFGTVLATMVTTWIRSKGLKIPKTEASKALESIKASCVHKSVEESIAEVAAFVASKK